MQNLPIDWGSLLALFVVFAYQMVHRSVRSVPFIPLTLLGIYFLVSLLLPFLANVPGLGVVVRWGGLVQTILLAWAVIRIAVYLFVEVPYKWTRGMGLPRVSRDFLLLLFFSVSGVILLRTEGQVNLTSLITTSAVLTMVVGLAVQSTLGNFFSGLAIQMERPFSVGDWIQLGEVCGKVVNVTWKATYLVTRENVQVHIPNSQIDSGLYLNYSRPQSKLLAKLPIGVEYGASPERVRAAVMEVVRQIPLILPDPPPEVRLINFGDFAITYEIRYWIQDYGSDERIRAELNNQLWYTLRRHNIKIPFPIRDVQHVHIERKHEQAVEQVLRDRVPAKLSRVSVLAPLAEEERALLAGQSRLVSFGAGEAVFRKGDAGDSMYIILEGACEVLGERGRVALLEAGGYFGEMSLLTGEARSATVSATRDTTLLRIEKDAFAAILQANPGIVEALGSALAERRAGLTQHGQRDSSADSQGFIRKIRAFFRL